MRVSVTKMFENLSKNWSHIHTHITLTKNHPISMAKEKRLCGGRHRERERESASQRKSEMYTIKIA